MISLTPMDCLKWFWTRYHELAAKEPGVPEVAHTEQVVLELAERLLNHKPPLPTQDGLRVINRLNAKFRSGNAIPIGSSIINRDEYRMIVKALSGS